MQWPNNDLQNITQKTKNRAIRTPIITREHVEPIVLLLLQSTVISHELGKNRIMITENET